MKSMRGIRGMKPLEPLESLEPQKTFGALIQAYCVQQNHQKSKIHTKYIPRCVSCDEFEFCVVISFEPYLKGT